MRKKIILYFAIVAIFDILVYQSSYCNVYAREPEITPEYTRCKEVVTYN